MGMTDQIPQHITVRCMAEKLDVCRATIYNMIKRGELPPLRKRGRNSRWRVDDLLPYADKFSGVSEETKAQPQP